MMCDAMVNERCAQTTIYWQVTHKGNDSSLSIGLGKKNMIVIIARLSSSSTVHIILAMPSNAHFAYP